MDDRRSSRRDCEAGDGRHQWPLDRRASRRRGAPGRDGRSRRRGSRRRRVRPRRARERGVERRDPLLGNGRGHDRPGRARTRRAGARGAAPRRDKPASPHRLQLRATPLGARSVAAPALRRPGRRPRRDRRPSPGSARRHRILQRGPDLPDRRGVRLGRGPGAPGRAGVPRRRGRVGRGRFRRARRHRGHAPRRSLRADR